MRQRREQSEKHNYIKSLVSVGNGFYPTIKNSRSQGKTSELVHLRDSMMGYLYGNSQHPLIKS